MSTDDFDHTLSTIDALGVTRTDSPYETEGVTGKPYRWEIPEAEAPRVALPPSAMRAPPDKDAVLFRDAMERAAAFFVVVSRNNGYEGRDPAVITDDLSCGTVAGMLGIDIDTLADVLLDFKRRDLVAVTDSGMLRLRDIEALDRLSDGL